jgi:hypothetical protein
MVNETFMTSCDYKWRIPAIHPDIADELVERGSTACLRLRQRDWAR